MRDRVAREVQSQRRVIIDGSRVRVTPLWDAPAGSDSAEAGQWLDRDQWRQVGGDCRVARGVGEGGPGRGCRPLTK